MVTAKDVPADALIARLAEKLKGYSQVKPPEWAPFVKTGVSKEKPPDSLDWWYVRAASALRKLYVSGEPIGVERFRTIYGGRKKRGTAPAHFAKGSGTIVRRILQQLEQAGLVRATGKGRVLTPEGRSLVDKTARELASELASQRSELSRYL